MMYYTMVAVENWFTMISQKVYEGSQVLDTHVDRITSALEQGIEQLLNDESNPLGIILVDMKQKWDHLFSQFEIQGKKFLEDNLVINDWAHLLNDLGRNISQGWDEFHRKYLTMIQSKT